MPWQQYVADVAGEIDPDTGLPCYREVGILIPRQQGKTFLSLSLMVHRAIGFGLPHGRAQNVIYTAQTGGAARTKFEKDFIPALDASKLQGRYSPRMSIGHEAIRWSNKSWISLTSTTLSAGHGETLDLGLIDEAWAHQDDRLEQSFKPAMMTRNDAQLWWFSTAGKKDSYYLTSKVETGRSLVEAGVTDGIAYFEWSADPLADPADPETWRACMPALGYTVTRETISADQKSMKAAEFRRAYLNIGDSDIPPDWQVIAEAEWSGQRDLKSTANDPVALALDITHEHTFSSIAAAGARPDGGTHVEIIDHRVGTSWVVERLAELAKRHRPSCVVIQPNGPAGAFVTPLETAGVRVTTTNMVDMGQAAGGFLNAVRNREIWHRGDVGLLTAVAGAQKRPLGDSWVWARKGVSVDISPLVAATLATWGHTAHQQEGYDVLQSVW